MNDKQLLEILIAGEKAFKYAHENLRDELEDTERFNATYSALTGETPQTTYCINAKSAL